MNFIGEKSFLMCVGFFSKTVVGLANEDSGVIVGHIVCAPRSREKTITRRKFDFEFHVLSRLNVNLA